MNPLLKDTDGDGISDFIDEVTVVVTDTFPTLRVEFITPGYTPDRGTLRLSSPASSGAYSWVNIHATSFEANKAIFEYQFHPNAISGTYSIGRWGASSVDIETGRITDSSVYTFEVVNTDSIESTMEIVDFVIEPAADNSLTVELTISGAIGGIAQLATNDRYMSYLLVSFSSALG